MIDEEIDDMDDVNGLNDLDDNDELTITEAAKALGISNDTVRRRIKSGDIKAELRRSPSGKAQYFIRAIELTGAVRNVKVVNVEVEQTVEQTMQTFLDAVRQTIRKENVSLMLLAEDQAAALADQAAALADQADEIKALKDELAKVSEVVTNLKTELKRDGEERDQQITERMREIIEDQKRPKSFWQRLFG